MSRVVRQGALYRYRYRRRRRQVSAARQEAILVGRVGDHDRRAVRGGVAELASDRLDLVGPDVLRLTRLRHGDAVLRVVAAEGSRLSFSVIFDDFDKADKTEIEPRFCEKKLKIIIMCGD